MEANQFIHKVAHVSEMVTKLQESGGTNIVLVRKLHEYGEMWVMVVNIKDIPFVPQTCSLIDQLRDVCTEKRLYNIS
jgi:hypothetical protein